MCNFSSHFNTRLWTGHWWFIKGDGEIKGSLVTHNTILHWPLNARSLLAPRLQHWAVSIWHWGIEIWHRKRKLRKSSRLDSNQNSVSQYMELERYVGALTRIMFSRESYEGDNAEHPPNLPSCRRNTTATHHVGSTDPRCTVCITKTKNYLLRCPLRAESS